MDGVRVVFGLQLCCFLMVGLVFLVVFLIVEEWLSVMVLV